MATTLLTLPAELRNRIFEFIIPSPDDSQGYTPFSEAIQQQPALLHTCRQLGNELWPMYFSNIKLLVEVTSPEIQRFRQFVEATDEKLLSTLQRLSLTMSCAGHPEFKHLRRCIQAHSVLHDVELANGGRFETTESHGFWIREEAGQLIFGEVMKRVDSLGYSTCVHWQLLPVSVEKWEGERFRKAELLALIDELCANESIASRLGADSGVKQASTH